MGISRSDALRQNIVNACRFHYGTHGTAGDNTCTGGGRLQNDRGSPEPATHLMRNCGFLQGDVDHTSLGRFHALAYGLGDFVRLAKGVPHLAAAVPDNDNSAERKTAAA